MKHHRPLDSGEMRRVYDIAEDFQVLSLVHIQVFLTSASPYNTGYPQFDKVLKAHLKPTSSATLISSGQHQRRRPHRSRLPHRPH
ncbi:MAG: hypothetical protein IPP47_19985, partial [Bryobacterales bacterium]|nr:hypothetical protein [Bryobacterales bacterium]